MQDRSQELLKTFETEIIIIKNRKLRAVVSELIEKYDLKSDDSKIKKYSKLWTKIHRHALLIFDKLDLIKLIRKWKSFVKKFNLSSVKYRTRKFKSIKKEMGHLESLAYYIAEFVNKLKKRLKKFTQVPLNETDSLNAEIALNEYIDSADKIVKADDYKTSNLKQLDDLLAETDKYLEDNFGELEYKLDSTRSFIALAAPSMEGKTQAAFTLRRVRPLYFPLSEISPDNYVQDIYRNFHSHTKHLFYCIEDDLKSIEAQDQHSAITTDKLAEMGSVKLWTVGFLVELVRKGSKLTSSEDNWMRQYANMQEFNFPQMSTDEVPKDHFKGFTIFLDEYLAKTGTIFVRNLARLMGIKCVCSNTNTKIANIIGKNEASGATKGEPVRSIVITRLNSPCLPFLDETHKLTESINAIKSAALRNTHEEDEDTNTVCRFLKDFMDKQLKCLRPGAAVYVARTLRVLATTEKVRSGSPTLGWLLDFMTRQLASDFKTRKPSVSTANVSFFAKIGLLLPQSFYGAKDNSGHLVVPLEAPELIDTETAIETLEDVESDNDEEEELKDAVVITQDVGNLELTAELDIDFDINDERRKAGFYYQRKFLEFHLYYVTNPQIKGNWMFLTFLKELNGALRLVTYTKDFIEWSEEYTHFETNELLTTFACLSIPSTQTVSTLLRFADESIYGMPQSISNDPNPRAMARSGNTLEFSVAVSVTEASQHSFGTDEKVERIRFGTSELQTVKTREYSFRGQDGCTFVKNLIVNLIENVRFNFKIDSINVEFTETPEFDLKTEYLENCRIPYLYSVNRSIPVFRDLSDPQSDFYVERYIRTADGEKIDGKFWFSLADRRGRAVIECKNRDDELMQGDMKKILIKAIETKDALLSMIFCPQVVKSPSESLSLYKFCKKNKVNVYRVIKTAQLNFEVTPLYAEPAGVVPDPRLVCIIFESRRINEKFND